MLNLERLERMRLHGEPSAHKILGRVLLGPSYRLVRRTHIEVEGEENLQARPVIFAINHTDRYNYWPFQYWLWRRSRRYTATWVKGKYYESSVLGAFMEWTNNIPTPSQGYVISRDFLNTVGRAPTDAEYRTMQSLVVASDSEEGDPAHLVAELPLEVTKEARDMLGRAYEPMRESYGRCVQELLGQMRQRFVELNEEAFDKGLDLIIFPQGTRSIRLSRGRVGMVQAALHCKRAITPVGCSGSDKVYPGASPWAKGGLISYRVGQTLPYEEIAEAVPLPEGASAFDPQVAAKYREPMQALTDRVMELINALVDPEYRFDDGESDGVTGSQRFV